MQKVIINQSLKQTSHAKLIENYFKNQGLAYLSYLQFIN